MGLKSAPSGKHGDGGGLWLHKRDVASGKWVFLYTINKRRREMGLGGWPEVSLKHAREDAARWRQVVKAGRDPIIAREKERREQISNLHQLRAVAHDAFEARKAELKGEGIAGRWFSPLELHILPKLGHLPVAEIDQVAIRDALAPIWQTKASTADKALHRLKICLDHAAAMGLSVDLQATAKARALLGKQRHKVANIPALPWREVPAFYASLIEPSACHLALRFLILTAARSAPVRFARLEEIEGDVWTIPAERMKGREGKTEAFRVPLSPEALRVVAEARPTARDGFLFPSPRKGVISDATMSRMMERRSMTARPHGFRSSFRDWVSEATTTPHEIAETALAHITGNAVSRAYERTDHLEKRRALMAQWAAFVTGEGGTEKIVRIG